MSLHERELVQGDCFHLSSILFDLITIRFKYRGLSTELYFAWHNNIYENIERRNRESVVCKV